MVPIRLHTIPHETHRYETTGDWLVQEDGSIDIYVSDMRDADAEFLVALHELMEVWLALKHGVGQAAADDFDQGHPELEEPGCDPRAPYHKEHEAAEVLERVAAALIGKNWHEYEAAFETLVFPKTAEALRAAR